MKPPLTALRGAGVYPLVLRKVLGYALAGAHQPENLGLSPATATPMISAIFAATLEPPTRQARKAPSPRLSPWPARCTRISASAAVGPRKHSQYHVDLRIVPTASSCRHRQANPNTRPMPPSIRRLLTIISIHPRKPSIIGRTASRVETGEAKESHRHLRSYDQRQREAWKDFAMGAVFSFSRGRPSL